MTAPATREFATLAPGEVRELILSVFRAGLQQRINPETGVLFTEDEIARATQPGSRWWIQAQADDDYGQGEQRRALFLADQLQIDRASTAWLEQYHGPLWTPEGRLTASYATGVVRVVAPEGTTVLGSTTLPDLGAHWARNTAGSKFQVLETTVVPSAGYVDVDVSAMDAGAAGNVVDTGDVLTWGNRDPSMTTTCVAVEDFGGGANIETDAEWAARMLSNIRYRPGGGNSAQQRGWARKSSSAVDDAFVYPCAFAAGSTLIAITEKRAERVGPTRRIPTSSVLDAAIAYLTPPGSPVQPAPPRVLVTGVLSQPCALVVGLQMSRGVAGGWSDATPFPSYDPASEQYFPYVYTVTDQRDITLRCPDDTAPDWWPEGTVLSGSAAPRLMLWCETESRFEELQISSIEHVTGSGGQFYRVLLSVAPSFTMADVYEHPVCPYTTQHATIAAQLQAYFDSRGPGEVVAATDLRAGRCVRFPPVAEERPYRVDADAAEWVREATWAAAASLLYIDAQTPDIAGDMSLGPYMLTLGRAGVYPL